MPRTPSATKPSESEYDAFELGKTLGFRIEVNGSGYQRLWRIFCVTSGRQVGTYFAKYKLCLAFTKAPHTFQEPVASSMLRRLRVKLDTNKGFRE